MNLNEYEQSGQVRYAQLAETVSNILEIALRQHPDLRIQQIQHRAKGADSLRKKLAVRGLTEADQLEPSIKDLAGCRILLYTNADVQQLVHSSIFRDNFEIDWERTKFHYPFDEANADQLFISYNFVVRLKDPRTQLPEYSELAGMWCEVQIQTTLDHAWSEMAHDTIYKPESVGFGSRRLGEVRKRMTDIMQKYLLPAGFDFQKVADDVATLRKGYDLYARDPLKVLANCTDNSERNEVLRTFKEFVLPHYDDIRAAAPGIRAAMLDAVKAARALTPDASEAAYGRLSLHSPSAVLDLACDVLDRLQFLDEAAISSSFDNLCTLYADAVTEEERKRVIQSATRRAEHNLDIWNTHGPLVQELLAERIDKLSDEDLAKVQPLVVSVLHEVLKPEVGKTTSTYNTVTFHTGAVVAGDDLAKIRARAIRKLQDLFDRAATDGERAHLVQTLNTADRLASQGDTTVEFLVIVLTNAKAFVEFFTSRWSLLSYELRQKIEHDILWIYRRRGAVPEPLQDDANLQDAVTQLRHAMAAFRAVSDADPGYVAYKTLVGHNAVLDAHWDGDPLDRAYRARQIDQAIESFTVETFPWWHNIIERAAQTPLTDGAIFMAFRPFLKKLATAKPELAWQLLQDVSPDLSRFLPDVLVGLEQGPMRDQALAKVDEWVAQGRHLAELAVFCGAAKDFDPARLQRIYAAAVAAGDNQAVLWVLESASNHLPDAPDLVDQIFIPAVTSLSAAGISRWVSAVSYGNALGVIETLSSAQAEALIAALVLHPDVDYHVEPILIGLSKTHPQLVIDFFGARLKRKKALGEAARKADPRYEAMPFDLHELPQRADGLAQLVVDTTRRWCNEDSSSFQFEGGALISRLYPRVETIEWALAPLIASGDKHNIAYVLDVLQGYNDGEPSQSSLCRELIAALPPDDELIGRVQQVLRKTGVMQGEFGRVEALQHQKEHMQTWLSDARQNVRDFAAEQIRSLDRQAVAEQRRSMQELQLRKRQFGE